MPATAPQFKANANITPSTFVKIDPTANYRVIPATANTDKILGVATEETYYPQGVGNYDGFAAHVGNPVKVYMEGEVALLTIGAGGCTAGDYLTADASGNGVTLAFSGATFLSYGAIALETAAAGDLARVLVRQGFVTPA